MGKKWQHTVGFTITELVVVISVITILLGIAIVVYPGAQRQARDSQRKSDLTQVSAALGAYVIQKNNYVGVGSGCGINGNGNGWLSAGPSEIAAYPKSIATCLQEAGVLAAGTFKDPSDCVWVSGGACGTPMGQAQAYMKATCTKAGQAITYVMAHLEGSPRIDATIDALCDANSVSGFDSTTQKWGTNYGMNYYVIAK